MGRNRQGDITYRPYRPYRARPRQCGDWRYLAVRLDRCSRKAMGGDVREAMPENLVSEALRRALGGPIVHSDQGSRYTVTRVMGLLDHHGAVQRRCRHSHPR